MINLSPGYRHKLLDRIGTVTAQKWLSHVKSFQAYAGLRSLQLARQRNIHPPNRKYIYPLRCIFIVFSIEEFLLHCWSLFHPWKSAPAIRSNDILYMCMYIYIYIYIFIYLSFIIRKHAYIYIIYIHFSHPERSSQPFERIHKQILFGQGLWWDDGERKKEVYPRGRDFQRLVTGDWTQRVIACSRGQITFQTVSYTNILAPVNMKPIIEWMFFLVVISFFLGLYFLFRFFFCFCFCLCLCICCFCCFLLMVMLLLFCSSSGGGGSTWLLMVVSN